MSPDSLADPTEDPSARDARDPGPEVAGASLPAQADATNERGGDTSQLAPANAHWKAKGHELEEASGSAWGS